MASGDHYFTSAPESELRLRKVTVRLAGEHFTRRPLPLVAEAGFVIEESQRFKAGIVERLVAVKPADT